MGYLFVAAPLLEIISGVCFRTGFWSFRLVLQAIFIEAFVLILSIFVIKQLHYGTCGHFREADLLSLLESSLECLMEQWKKTNSAEFVVSNQSSDQESPMTTVLPMHELCLCYKACVLLLESVIWLNKSSGTIESSHQSNREPDCEPDLREAQLNFLASSAIRLLWK